MTTQDLITLIQNSGVTVVVLVYFMWRDHQFMSSLQTTLTTLVDTVDTLKDYVKELKNGVTLVTGRKEN